MHPREGPKGVREILCVGDGLMGRTFFIFENGVNQVASRVTAAHIAG